MSESARRDTIQVRSQPVLWWRLINDAEEFRERTGWGLAGLWGYIHRGEYAIARSDMDALLAAGIPDKERT